VGIVNKANQLTNTLLDFCNRSTFQVTTGKHYERTFVIGLAKLKQGHNVILIMFDRLSKMVYLIPTTMNVTAKGTASLVYQHVFRLHGVPKSTVSDRDVRFTSHFWQALHEQLGTKLRMSTAYHPQTDGLTERLNRTMQQMLRNHVDDNADDWSDCLPAVEFAINN
jgi:hypothetical protein